MESSPILSHASTIRIEQLESGLWVMWLVFVFAFGACMGSFFNVCIYRIPRGLSLSHPGSHCWYCGKPIRWFDNIPVISWWLLRGRCRYCAVPFSVRYSFIELLTAGLYAFLYIKFGLSFILIPAISFLSLLIIGSFTDLDHWIIPDRITLGGCCLGILLAAIPKIGMASENPLNSDILMSACLSQLVPESLMPSSLMPLITSCIGAIGGYALMWSIAVFGRLVFKKEAMGGGDIKLFAMFGAFLGPTSLFIVLMLASMTGITIGAFGLFLNHFIRRNKVDQVVEGPPIHDPEWFRTAELLVDKYSLKGWERELVLDALKRPGSLSKSWGHLPFGPSLAIAGFIVYLYGDVWMTLFFGFSPLMPMVLW